MIFNNVIRKKNNQKIVKLVLVRNATLTEFTELEEV